MPSLRPARRGDPGDTSIFTKTIDTPFDTLIRLIAEYGLLVVLVNILMQQLGAPVPGYPMPLITGALAARSGRRVLRTLYRISLSPNGCVRQTESIFTRFGAPSLLLARFIPGFASVATALAGAMRIPRGAFLLFDALGPELTAHPKDALIVVHCACPNDASAVIAARQLLACGCRDVRPLAGGIDAWTAAGLALEA